MSIGENDSKVAQSKLAIVILNYNGRTHLQQFLPSVIEHCPKYAEIIIADNKSTDDSIAYLQEHYPNLTLIVLNENTGFAGGYANALKLVKSDYYLILNSDVELTSTSIDPIIQYLDKNPNVAACQPKIKAFRNKSRFEYAGACGGWVDRLRYPFCRGRILNVCEEDQGQYDTPMKIFWCTGAAMFIRSEVYHQSGGFDPKFFAHMEEIDLCWRIQRMGHDLVCLPESVVFHLGGGTLSYDSPFKTYLNFRNSLAMILKNESATLLPLKLIARLVLDGIAACWMLISSPTPVKSVIAVLKAHFSFYGMIPYLLKQRRQFSATLNSQRKNQIHGYWKGSIIWAFFIRKLRKFSHL